MNSFPLVAVAGLSEAEQMADFYQGRRAWLLGAGAASALLIAVVILVSAWSWQLAKARRRPHAFSIPCASNVRSRR